MDSTGLAQLAYDRTEIAETFCRYAAGLDHNNADVLASALSEDCMLDFSTGGAKLGLDFSVLHGREEVVNALITIVGPLDTSHTFSNLQTEVKGDSAHVNAYMMAQHFMPGHGPKRGSENALLMNRYDADLVRDGQQWRFQRITIDNVWAQGDPQIITALATHRARKTQKAARQ